MTGSAILLASIAEARFPVRRIHDGPATFGGFGAAVVSSGGAPTTSNALELRFVL